MSLWNSFVTYPSQQINPNALFYGESFILISIHAGRTMGLNESDNGHIGAIPIDLTSF